MVADVHALKQSAAFLPHQGQGLLAMNAMIHPRPRPGNAVFVEHVAMPPKRLQAAIKKPA
jgi:hypothetical protein